jgi:hypothetical protein
VCVLTKTRGEQLNTVPKSDLLKGPTGSVELVLMSGESAVGFPLRLADKADVFPRVSSPILRSRSPQANSPQRSCGTEQMPPTISEKLSPTVSATTRLPTR